MSCSAKRRHRSLPRLNATCHTASGPRQQLFCWSLLNHGVSTKDGVFVALESRELPAVERFTGSELLPVCPAFRLPQAILETPDIEEFLRQRCAELGVIVEALIPLGGEYARSAGATPELVTPFAAPIAAISADLKLAFTSMQPLYGAIDELLDAHTKIALLWLGHAVRG